MNKLVMGDQFSTEGIQIETEVKETVEETEEVTETEEKETPTEASTEKKPAESEETPSSETEEEGDTPEEKDQEKLKALEELRQEESRLDKDVTELDAEIERRKQSISQKRAERRERREIVKTVGQAAPEVDELKDIDKDTLEILERYTKAKGLVPKSELAKRDYDNEQKRAQNSFFKAHPQYLPQNDKDDHLYNALMSELGLYAPPKDPAMLQEIYERAHREVKTKFPNSFPKSTQSVQVSQHRIQLQRGSSGGTSPGSATKTEGKFTEKQLSIMRNSGYSEEDIKELEQYK